MVKAYDLQDLLGRLKKDGLALAETEVAQIYKHLKEWSQDSAKLSENKIDDVIAPLESSLDPVLLPLIDKISPDVETKA